MLNGRASVPFRLSEWLFQMAITTESLGRVCETYHIFICCALIVVARKGVPSLNGNYCSPVKRD